VLSARAIDQAQDTMTMIHKLQKEMTSCRQLPELPIQMHVSYILINSQFINMMRYGSNARYSGRR
jgi:hypothetical protein